MKPLLVNSRLVAQRYNISTRTINRWLSDPQLSFPQPLIINRRRYWDSEALTEWERARAAVR
jgi:hypothetical protein